MARVPLKCHRCHAPFLREWAKTAEARGRKRDYCSVACHRADESVRGAERRQAREQGREQKRDPYKPLAHQQFVFLPSERTRVMDNPPAPMATEGRDVESARPDPRKVEIPARAMPSVRVF